MGAIARRLLAEKLIDDFYEETLGGSQERPSDVSPSGQDLTEQLKALLAVDQHELLFRWEAHCHELCSLELRRFADFVARMLVSREDQSNAASEVQA